MVAFDVLGKLLSGKSGERIVTRDIIWCCVDQTTRTKLVALRQTRKEVLA